MIRYEFLLSKITRPMMPIGRPGRIAPVTRIEPRADTLAIPRHVAPTDADKQIIATAFGFDIP
jgi:hypothetical protein